ncbi:MAG: hypothetical protein B5M48_03820 [Candidatus Omnitrophica bacterium 4484_213]|nr:MAG: hypothetical protein B5M48_03820 [Candidatus Omnitrophica bacterium 4484_213]
MKIKKVNSTLYTLKSLDGNIIEVGNKVYPSPIPYIKLSKWEEEVTFTLHIPYVKREKPNEFADSKLKWSDKDFDVVFYPKEPEEVQGKDRIYVLNEHGGLEFDVVLKSKPDTNLFEFPFVSKNLSFHYQSGDKDCPDKLVGSYSAYHKAKQGGKYKTGKVFHIYRPKIIDSKGNWVWGKLNIDEKNKILSIEIPQEFLDNAAYPVIIDPTFGYTAKGSKDIIVANEIHGSFFEIPEDGTATSMTAWLVVYGNGNVKCAIYKKSDNSLVASTEERSFTVSDYLSHEETFNFSGSPSLAGNTEYYLVYWTDAYIGIAYDDETGKGVKDEQTYGAWPDPLVPVTEDKKFSIYCTYTTGGGGLLIPVAMSDYLRQMGA